VGNGAASVEGARARPSPGGGAAVAGVSHHRAQHPVLSPRRRPPRTLRPGAVRLCGGGALPHARRSAPREGRAAHYGAHVRAGGAAASVHLLCFEDLLGTGASACTAFRAGVGVGYLLESPRTPPGASPLL
ncbi:MAG: hypothetical protein AVDCRST_MAG28-2881, partial [uncultured Rubrobacteraceae bacterium]